MITIATFAYQDSVGKVSIDAHETPMINHRTKGIPGLAEPFLLSCIAEKKWNVLRGDMPLPLAILKEAALDNNARWIMAFVQSAGVSLCPHGKTTMCPQIFRRQLGDGAWGITLSTPHQVQTARDFGIRRILLANQLVDPTFIDYLAVELDHDPGFDFYCLVDSLDGVSLLEARVAARKLRRPLQVLLEIGMPSGRTGCRSEDEAIAVARAVNEASHLALRGVEGFEGIVPESTRHDPQPVVAFLRTMARIAEACCKDALFTEGEVILSAGGSAYFDIVTELLSAAIPDRPTRIVLRSGCYVSHDSDMYVAYFDAIKKRSRLAREIPGQLAPALEVLAYVQSLPEPSLALLTMGKRDCSYDHHLPTPLKAFTRAGSVVPLSEEYRVIGLNDQHAYMRIPSPSPLAVGDIISLGVSHPCTTFDKWDVLYGVDDDYNVVSAYKTYF